ncbi:MAG TPA: ABC transporter permease [Acidobacteriaceae bacterium]
MLSDLRYRLRAFFRLQKVEDELQEELQYHLEREAEKFRKAGTPSEEAMRQARLALGGAEQVQQKCREARGTGLVENLLQDLRYGVRTLRKSSGFSIVVVLTLALGIGACTAIFSVVNSVLLLPLPYADPDRLVIAGMDLQKRNVRGLPFSNADFIDLRDGTKAFIKDLAGVFTGPALVPREDGTSEQIRWAVVTTNFFRVMDARIVLGRDFTDQDGVPQAPTAPTDVQAPQATPMPVIAILSYEYFQRRYAGDANVLGHTMRTTGGPGLVIVGVLAPRFRLYFPSEANVESAPDVWIANRLGYDAAQRKNFSIRPVGRLKNGVALEQAQAAVDQVTAEARKNFPIAQTAGYYFRLEPMRQHLVAEVRPAILALMGSVIFLLLIACANVANLLLVRASLQERELAMRSAMGAGPWRLVCPILSQVFLLVTGGILLGLALAWAGIHELRTLAPANLPRLDSIRIDAFVLGITILVGVAAAGIVVLAPAWRASRPELMNALRSSTRTSGLATGGRVRNLVVVAEVALSFTLLIGSGLMFRSFLQLQRVDPGFDARRLLTFQVLGVPAVRKTAEERVSLIRQIEERLRAIPGVHSTTASFPFPLTGDFAPIRWGTGEALSDPSKFQATDNQIVLPGYFETMRTPLLAGRTFTDDDNLPGRNRVIIDELLAKKAFGRQSAVGKRILVRIRTPEPEWVEVVGVVAHQRATSLAEPGREQVYFTDGFLGSGRVRTWAIRTGSDAASYENQVRAAIKEINPSLVVTEMQPMEAIVHDAQANTRFSLLLIAVFAIIAGLLAGVGLYGVLSSAVRQRTSEIGLRMALGAQRTSIFAGVVGQGLRLSALGIAAGLIAAFILTRAMITMLVGVKPADPATFISISVVFLAISALASYLPARRAAGLDPMTALREE